MERRSARRAAAAAPLISLAAALLASGCASLGLGASPIEVQLVALTPLPSTGFENRLRVDLRLRNPNDRAYRIDGLRFVLDVNGQRLLSGMSDAEATLPRLGEVVVPVTTSTSLLDLLNQILAFGRRQQPGFTYELRGKIFLAGRWGSLSFSRHGSSADLLPQRASAR
jgi:hypothetical protein